MELFGLSWVHPFLTKSPGFDPFKSLIQRQKIGQNWLTLLDSGQRRQGKTWA
jgi:hypothetical protein